jgi:hypothetical protein
MSDPMPDPVMSARMAALALLGLPERATAPQVTRAYRRLAKSTHPDVTGPLDRDAASRFAALTAAYRLLLDASSSPQSSPQSSSGQSSSRRSSPPQSPSPQSARPSPSEPRRPRGPVPVPIRVTRPTISVGPVRISPLPPRSRRST